MSKYRVVETENNGVYILENAMKKQFSLQIELYGLASLLKGDIVYLCDELVDTTSPNFVQPYAFEKCNETDCINIDKNEVMIVERNSKNILFKRIYG